VSSRDFVDLILDLDRNPVRRTTVYEPIESGIDILGHLG
jgi:hypothetical protein